MPRLVSGDLRFVLQRETNVVKTIQQAVAHKIVDRKLCVEALVIAHLALLQIDGEFVSFHIAGASHQLSRLIFLQANGEEPIFCAVVSEDVGERGRNHDSETEVR